jgi:arylsulfatase A-like enzyme
MKPARLLVALAAVVPCLPPAARAADSPSAGPAEDRRPNIFFFFADDWGRYASVYDQYAPNAAIKTPRFDAIARRGVRFNNAHVTAPSCTPCRSSLLSGQYFYRTGRGAILQGAVWDESIPSFPLLLEKSGYHIGYTYKVWSPGTPRDAPYGGDRTRYQKAGVRFNRFSQNVTAMVARGTDREAAKREIYGEVMANFEAFLADRKAGQPFCYWFGPTNTHREWTRGSGHALWDLNPDDLKGRMPAFLPDVPEIREDMCDYFGEALALDVMLGRFLERLEAMGELANTLVVVSGDHGIPGFPRGKCNLYDLGTQVSLFVRWDAKAPGGRTVDDFVNLMDLAPTFLEAGGVAPPDCMTGRSILPLLLSEKSGQIDPSRDCVVTGRERHVAAARDGNLPYPQRAIRTKDFLYIRNFKPDRWPMGAPRGLGENEKTPAWQELEHNTFVTFADMDASPTKAWMVANRNGPRWQVHWQLAFGLRPAEELYDLRKDADQMKNVADDPAYAETRRHLSDRLMRILKETGDPRVEGDGGTFDRPPYAP